MKAETAAFLRKSREFLAKARSQLKVMNYNDEAGRAAYLAGLHAAQAQQAIEAATRFVACIAEILA